MKIPWLEFIVFAGVFAAGFALSQILYDGVSYTSFSGFDENSNITEECSNMTLQEASICTNKIFKTFYIYNMSNYEKRIDFETLKSEGGVCSHWSDYYEVVGDSLGFKTEGVIIKINSTNAHKFMIWSNDDGYCIMDQRKRWCVGL